MMPYGEIAKPQGVKVMAERLLAFCKPELMMTHKALCRLYWLWLTDYVQMCEFEMNIHSFIWSH